MSEGAATERGTEILPLTGLRALLAWWVVFFHFGEPVFAGTWPWRVLHSGYLAVDVFFALSGFVLARRYATTELGTGASRRAFSGKRLARVYPLYLVSLAIGFAAGWPATGVALRSSTGRARAVLQLLGLNAWAHIAMFAHNWAAWSLSVEIFFYALFPLLFPALRRLSRRGMRALLVGCFAAVLAAPLLYSALGPDHLDHPLGLGDEVLWSWYLKFFPLQRLPEFVAGALVALLTGRERTVVSARAGIGAAALLLGIAVSGIVPYAYLQAGVLLPLVVTVLASLDRARVAVLSARGVVLLGRASYATYILHVPLFLMAARFDPGLWQTGSHVVAYLLFLLAVSLAAHRFIEEPARKAVTAWMVGRRRAFEEAAPR
ncbi:MAG: Acyltransferase 3 [Labilithrix sp.]|nr:Acyltransferase 3 [Labilithrix sp.]